jgi:hypothetical protein
MKMTNRFHLNCLGYIRNDDVWIAGERNLYYMVDGEINDIIGNVYDLYNDVSYVLCKRIQICVGGGKIRNSDSSYEPMENVHNITDYLTPSIARKKSMCCNSGTCRR